MIKANKKQQEPFNDMIKALENLGLSFVSMDISMAESEYMDCVNILTFKRNEDLSIFNLSTIVATYDSPEFGYSRLIPINDLIFIFFYV